MHPGSMSILIRSAVLAMAIALSALAPTTLASAHVAPPMPALTVSTTSVNPPAVLVRGEGFTPGGRVYVAFLNPWGRAAYDTRWTTASEDVAAATGQDDAYLGRPESGVVVEEFEHFCGQQVMVRAYDQATGTWSNVVDFSDAC